MRRLRGLRCRAYARLGHRGLFLLLIGVVAVLYGAGLLDASGYDPHRVHWWPASTGQLGGLSLDTWGVVWCLTGTLCLAAAWAAADQIAYAAAVLLNTTWAAFAVQRWLTAAEPGSWSVAAIYSGIALGIILVAGWPEVPKTPLVILPPPPDPQALPEPAPERPPP